MVNGQKIKERLKFLTKDPVLLVSIILAIISCFFVKPTAEYFGYIDYAVICILYSLMVVIAGLKKAGAFNKCINLILRKVNSTRTLSLILIFLCFFMSMLITNDVALITFVPLTIMIFADESGKKFLIPVIVLETVAANLGSQFTPIGNPQNLYIYSLFDISLAEFIWIMLPLTAGSFLLVFLSTFFIKNEKIGIKEEIVQVNVKKIAIWVLLFLVCILSVMHILSYIIALAVVICVACFIDRKTLIEADFALLFTFIFFFIFIGNMKNIPQVRVFLEGIISGRELICAILLSQVVSNVPAAMLVSGFTENYKELLFGVNLGGLGTLIASMASLISYKMYVGVEEKGKGKYVLTFTLVNVAFLIILYGFVKIFI